MTDIERKIQKIKESNIDQEDKDVLIASYMTTNPNKPYLFTNNFLNSLKTFDTIDEFNNVSEEDKDELVASYMTTNPDTPYLFTNNFLSSQKTFDTIDMFNNLDSISNSMNNNVINTSSNNNGGIFNSSYSNSNSSFSSTNSDGNTIVHNNNISNVDGKVNRTSDCYKVDIEGNRTNIECNNTSNKKISLKKENFPNSNNYGKSIKIIHK